MNEEPFAPVALINPFRSEEEMIARPTDCRTALPPTADE